MNIWNEATNEIFFRRSCVIVVTKIALLHVNLLIKLCVVTYKLRCCNRYSFWYVVYFHGSSFFFIYQSFEQMMIYSTVFGVVFFKLERKNGKWLTLYGSDACKSRCKWLLQSNFNIFSFASISNQHMQKCLSVPLCPFIWRWPLMDSIKND